MKKKIVIIISVFAVILACTWAYKYITAKEKIEKTIVNTEILKPEEIDNAEFYQGTLISRESVFIQPQVSGQISNIYVKAGDKVQKGTLLILIDTKKQEAILNSYKLKMPSLESDLSTAKIQYERYKELYEKKTVSKQDFENAENEYKRAKSALDTNSAQIKEQTEQLDYHKIKAPFSGIIGDIPVKEGEYVNPATMLLSVTQNERLELNAGISADKIFNIKIGLPVQILDFKNNIITESKIDFISPRVDSSTQTILIKAYFKNINGLLKADQSVKIKIIYSKNKGLLIPVSSTSFLGGQDFAFIVKEKDGEKIVKQVPITLGELQNGKYIVKKGLQEGDEIVTKGIQKLYDEAYITIEQSEEIE